MQAKFLQGPYEIVTVLDTAEADDKVAARAAAKQLIEDALPQKVDARIIRDGQLVEAVFTDEYGNLVFKGLK